MENGKTIDLQERRQIASLRKALENAAPNRWEDWWAAGMSEEEHFTRVKVEVKANKGRRLEPLDADVLAVHYRGDGEYSIMVRLGQALADGVVGFLGHQCSVTSPNASPEEK